MTQARAEVPRCAHHENVPAAVQCRSCGHFLCRLCVHIEAGLDTCVDCHAACRDLQIRPEPDTYFAAVEFTHSAKPARARIDSVPQVREQRAAEKAAPAQPRPLPHAKVPPFFCKNHPELKATHQCRHCSEEYCDACAKMVEGNPLCPECSGPIHPLLPEDQGLPRRSIVQNMADAMLFPFRGSGPVMLLFGSVLVLICNYGGWKSLIFSYAFMYTFGIKICNTSALGRRTPPDWPGLGDIGNAVSYFVAWVVSQIPAFAYLILLSGVSLSAFLSGIPDDSGSFDAGALMSGDSEGGIVHREESQQQKLTREAELEARKAAAEQKLKAAQERQAARLVPFYVLSLLGNLYLPMAVLALILFRSYSALNPFFIATSSLRAGSGYLGAVLTFIAADIFRMLPGVCGELLGDTGIAFFVVPVISAPIFLYLLMVSMRALGVMYYFNQRRLAWFE